jgi:hypothetical protein
MTVKKITIGAAKILLLSIIMFVLWAAFAGLFTNLLVEGGTSSGSSGQNIGLILLMMLVVSIVHTSILSFVISRAAWRGIKLASTVALQIFGIQFLLTLSEAVYFDQPLGLPDKFALANLIGGACMAVVFSLAAVAVYGAPEGAG